VSGKSLPDYALYHHVIPILPNREDGTRPYWPSSPYSLDHGEPNDPTMGDQHPWGVGMTKEHGVDFWAYRTFVDRLPNEGGFLGASLPATLRQFLPENERRMGAPAWTHHDNTVNFWDASYQVTTRVIESWLGRDGPGRLRNGERPPAGRGAHGVHRQLSSPHVQQRRSRVLDVQRLVAGHARLDDRGLLPAP